MKPEKPKGMPDVVWELTNLKDEDHYEREKTAAALGNIKHESAVPFLIQTLKDKNKDVRRKAAWALGKIGHESAIPHLIEALKDEDRGVRGYAVEALGEIKHESAVEPLTQTILKDENENVRGKAVEALDKNVDSLEEKQEQGKKLTPEGKKVLNAIKLVKPYFRKDEYVEVKARALQDAYKGKIDENNVRLHIKILRAMKGNLK